ncbi:MAG: HAD-IA family hydrolase [Planctomycetota bacterium]
MPVLSPDDSLADLDSRYRGLIFDCDGTLTNSMPLHYRAWHETMRRHGIEFPEQQFYAMGGMPTDKIISVLSEQQSVQVDIDAASDEKEHAFEALIDQVQALPHVVDLAKKYAAIMPCSVASGGIRPMIDRQLIAIGIIDLFDAGCIVTSEDTQRHKPHPDVFLEAACRMKVPADKCLVFEDSDLGITAAAAAEMDCVDVRTMLQTPPE